MQGVENMNKIAKEFLDRLDTMLENDKDIDVNSVNELIKKVDKYRKELNDD